MANAPEEDAPQETEAEAVPKSGGGSMKMIIIAVALVVVLGGGGAGAWFFFLRGSAEPEQVAPKEGEPQGVSRTGPIVSLEPFIVNLADPKGKRYLKVGLDMELSNKAVDKELQKRMPMIRDQIIMALSSKTFQQIQGVPGKNVLRDELTARTNAILKSGKVKKIYFTTFIVQ